MSTSSGRSSQRNGEAGDLPAVPQMDPRAPAERLSRARTWLASPTSTLGSGARSLVDAFAVAREDRPGPLPTGHAAANYRSRFRISIRPEWAGKKISMPSSPMVIGPSKYLFAAPRNMFLRIGDDSGGMTW